MMALGAAERDRLVAILREDYARFPQDQTFEIYAPDVYFRDPLNEFRGCDRFRQTIGFMERWFRDPRLDLHAIAWHEPNPNRSLPSALAHLPYIRTDWTLSWTTPLPWQPRITIPGWSELTVAPEGDRAGLLVAHVDDWYCSPWNVVAQHWGAALVRS